MQAGEALQAPHIDHTAAVLDHKEDAAFVDAFQHLSFSVDVASHIVVGAKADLVILDAFAFHPLHRFAAVTFVAAGAKDNVHAGIVEDIAKADDRMGRLVLGHPFEERIPILWLGTNVVLASRYVSEGPVYIENRDLAHALIMAAIRVKSVLRATQ